MTGFRHSLPVALVVGLWSAQAGANVDSSGIIHVENDGVATVQMMYSGAGFRDVLVLNNRAVPTPLTNCGENETYSGGQTLLANCVYDIGFCQARVTGYPTACDPVIENGGNVPSCDCRSGETVTIGNVTGSLDTLDFWLYVDNTTFTAANGDTIDNIWKPSGPASPDPDNPTKPHLRTTQLSADSYLLEWEDLPAAVSDADQNDVVALVQILPNNCQQSAANPAFCSAVTFYPDPALQQVRTASRAIVEEQGTVNRRIGLQTKVYNFASTPISLAICPMLTIPKDPTSAGENFQEYGYVDINGIAQPKPQCGPFATGSGADLSISFGSKWHDTTAANHCVAETEATTDILPILPPSGNPQVPGETDFTYYAFVSNVDTGVVDTLNQLTNKTESQIRTLIYNNNNPTPVIKNLFYNVDPSFSCVTGTNTHFLLGNAAAIPPSIGTLASAITFPFSVNVNSPATVRISTTPPGLEDPMATPVDAVMDFTWTDNIPEIDPTRGHLFGIIQAELPPQNIFPAGGTGFHSELVTLNFSDQTPEGFRGTLTALLRDHNTGKVLLNTTITFAKDHTPPTVGAISSERDENGVNVTAVATDPAAGIGQGDLVANINGSSQTTTAMSFGPGDFFYSQTLLGTVGANASEGVAIDFAVDDTHFDKVTVPSIPVAASGGNRFVECHSPSGAKVTLDGSKSTGDGSQSYLWTGPFGSSSAVTVVESFGIGASTVRLALKDSRGYTSGETSVITVGDTTPPEVTCESVFPACIWPPNHKLVKYVLGQNLRVNLKDTCDTSPTVRIAQVTDNQGHVIPSTDTTVELEADKGRVYTIKLELRDKFGNESFTLVGVRVPLSERGCDDDFDDHGDDHDHGFHGHDHGIFFGDHHEQCPDNNGGDDHHGGGGDDDDHGDDHTDHHHCGGAR